MASTRTIADANALLLYKVGPVLCCSPTKNIEAVVTAQSIVRPPGITRLRPGVFKYTTGIVSIVDLRIAFGVTDDAGYNNGRIIIANIESDHPGFWVDEIIDVIEFPKTGWSNIPPLIPREVFDKTLLLDEKIRLYCQFEKLNQYNKTGYLRNYIQQIENYKQEETEKDDNIPEKTEIAKSDSYEKLEYKDVDLSVASGLSSDKNHDDERASEPEEHADYVQPLTEDRSVMKHDSKLQARATSLKDYDNEINSKADTMGAPDVGDYNYSVNKNEFQESNKRIERAIDKKYTNGVKNKSQSEYRDRSKRQYQDEADGFLILVAAAVVIMSLLLVGVYYLLDSEEKNRGEYFAEKSTQADVPLEIDIDLDLNSEHHGVKSAGVTLEQSGASIEDNTKISVPIEQNQTASMHESDTKKSAIVDIEKDEQGYVIRIDETEADYKDNQISVEVDDDQSKDLAVLTEALKDSTDIQQINLHRSNENLQEGSLLDSKVDSKTVQKTIDSKPSVDGNLQPVKVTREIIHIVVKGDTLWHIAKRYVHNPFRYPELARLSNINNPDLIYPGDRVKILITSYR